MKKTILTIGGCALAGTAICGVLYAKLHIGLWLTLAITAGTTAYHIWMLSVVCFIVFCACGCSEKMVSASLMGAESLSEASHQKVERSDADLAPGRF